MKIKSCLLAASCFLLIAPSNPSKAAASADNTIRPFKVNTPEADLTDLRRRINATRWPEKETVTDAKAFPKLTHFNTLPKGGHFAAWERPEFFVNEMRASFKSLS